MTPDRTAIARVVPHRRGRPRTLAGTAAAVPVSVRLPTPLHDQLAVESLRRKMSLAAILRERLTRDPAP